MACKRAQHRASAQLLLYTQHQEHSASNACLVSSISSVSAARLSSDSISATSSLPGEKAVRSGMTDLTAGSTGAWELVCVLSPICNHARAYRGPACEGCLQQLISAEAVGQFHTICVQLRRMHNPLAKRTHRRSDYPKL